MGGSTAKLLPDKTRKDNHLRWSNIQLRKYTTQYSVKLLPVISVTDLDTVNQKISYTRNNTGAATPSGVKVPELPTEFRVAVGGGF